MKKWFWLGLLFAFATIGAILFYGYIEHPRPTASQVTATNPPEISLPIPTFKVEPLKKVNAPKVSNQRLLADIQALNFERYEDSSRSKTRDYIVQQLKESGWTPTLQTFEGGVNIVAERSGTNPQAGKILVAAHYDTVIGSPGADDNASGIATILEVARLLGNRTRRTLQVAFFDLEERGLLGSLAFASKAENLKNLQGAIVLDMVGFACHTSGCQQYPQGLPITPPSDKGDFLAVAGDVEHMQLLDAFGESSKNGLPPVVTLPIPFKGAATPDLLRSDHAPFWMRGIGAVLVTDTANFRTPHYHEETDKPDTLDREFFVGAAQIVTNATATLLESAIAN